MIKRFIFPFFLIPFLLLTAWFLIPEELTQAIRVTIYVIAGLTIVGTIAATILGLWLLYYKAVQASIIKPDHNGNFGLMPTRKGMVNLNLIGSQDNPWGWGIWRYSMSDKEFTTEQRFDIPALQFQNEPNQVDLLTALNSVQRCLVVGASNAGKTTLFKWLASIRLNNSKVIIIDPHAYPNKWPSRCTVVGAGRDYVKIDEALTALVKLMTKRYDEIGKGIAQEMSHEKVCIIIDEWRAITANLGKPASEAIKSLLTESRKAAFSVFVGSHSERAKPLGLEGEYDLKEGFTVVRLTIVDGMRRATIDQGNGEVLANLPGPWADNQPVPVIENSLVSIPLNPMLSEEKLILSKYNEGKSYNQIAREVFGSIGGNQTQKIKDILFKNGM